MSVESDVIVELEFGANEPIGEPTRVDAERAHVSRHLLAFFVDSPTKDNLEYAVTRLIRFAIDESHEVGSQRRGQRPGRNRREIRARDIDTGAGTFDLSHFEVVNEERRDQMHGSTLTICCRARRLS